MKDKYISPRKKSKLEVVISHPALGKAVGRIRDMSESGVVLIVDQSELFKCGHIVGAHIVGDRDVNIEPLLSMEVMRVEFSSIALNFVDVSEAIEPCLVDQNAIENSRRFSLIDNHH